MLFHAPATRSIKKKETPSSTPGRGHHHRQSPLATAHRPPPCAADAGVTGEGIGARTPSPLSASRRCPAGKWNGSTGASPTAAGACGRGGGRGCTVAVVAPPPRWCGNSASGSVVAGDSSDGPPSRPRSAVTAAADVGAVAGRLGGGGMANGDISGARDATSGGNPMSGASCTGAAKGGRSGGSASSSPPPPPAALASDTRDEPAADGPPSRWPTALAPAPAAPLPGALDVGGTPRR